MYDPARDAWNAADDGASGKPTKDETESTSAEEPETTETIPPQSTDTNGDKPPPAQSSSSIATPSKETEEEGKTDAPQQANDPSVAKRALSPQTQSPPRKFKRPLTRVSQRERDEKTREIREKMERRERPASEGSQNSRSSEHDNHGRPNSSVRSEDDRQPRERVIVRDHYNRLQNMGQARRRESPIIKLRNFNNWVKSILIYKYSQQGDVVLDIGCGKGGDLWKWGRSRIQGFIGIDVADVSIQHAQERYDGSKKFNFWADLCVGDAFEQRIEDIVSPNAFPVSIVSCQFCLHYSFESETRVRTLLSNVSRALLPGHFFIGTIPNSDVIVKHIRKLGPNERKWSNTIYSVEFENDPPRDGNFNPPFGHKYTFFLEDAVGNVPEYVVPFDAFCDLCEEYNLVLDYKKPFLQLFDEEKSTRRGMDLTRNIGVIKEDGSAGIDGDEKEACEFYLAFAFRKI